MTLDMLNAAVLRRNAVTTIFAKITFYYETTLIYHYIILYLENLVLIFGIYSTLTNRGLLSKKNDMM